MSTYGKIFICVVLAGTVSVVSGNEISDLSTPDQDEISDLSTPDQDACNYYKQFAGNLNICTPTAQDGLFAPDAKKTLYGGIDVTDKGCKVKNNIPDTCCGILPRWNWILGTCDNKTTTSQACMLQASKSDIYYIAAYQWDGSKWNQDPASSISAPTPGGLIADNPRYADMKITGPGSECPSGGDWQNKWAPSSHDTSQKTATQGLGPPGFMFVLSAKSIEWITLFALTQTNINRGPENQWGSKEKLNNCWYAELDFLEAPFWRDGSGNLPCYIPDATFMSTGAQYGGCFPMGAKFGREFEEECTTAFCCEGTQCDDPVLSAPYLDPNEQGRATTACGKPDQVFPSGDTVFGRTRDQSSCGRSRALGGCASSSYFDSDATQEYIYAFVVDKSGTWGYRWKSDDEGYANSVWPGLNKFSAASVITSNRPIIRPDTQSTPCPKSAKNCVIFHPGAAGTKGCMGNGAKDNVNAISTAMGHNWWDLFEDTKQMWNYTSQVVPVIQAVKTPTPDPAPPTYAPHSNIQCNPQAVPVQVCPDGTRCETSELQCVSPTQCWCPLQHADISVFAADDDSNTTTVDSHQIFAASVDGPSGSVIAGIVVCVLVTLALLIWACKRYTTFRKRTNVRGRRLGSSSDTRPCQSLQTSDTGISYPDESSDCELEYITPKNARAPKNDHLLAEFSESDPY